ncbi:hypothetical protein DPMN_066731 [Dreissena polymorpha]|uniref:Uncharacterized protein n=1 Tax=Dreissena polymorpha TaxID=45954 RepID=A0A9D4BSA3_DREPO|nr:hypothetical protein DPMN_066731 [Dreissena polymorpha]
MIYNVKTSVQLKNALQRLKLYTTAECSSTSKPLYNYRMISNVLTSVATTECSTTSKPLYNYRMFCNL